MRAAQSENWFALLPLIGQNIEIYLQNGAAMSIPHGRICGDEQAIHINSLGTHPDAESAPIVTGTREILIRDIVKISFRTGGNQFTFLGKTGNHWLCNLPKSGKNAIFILSNNLNRMLSVERGWLEYDQKKIYIREIVRTRHGNSGYEIASHERLISEVTAILVNDGLAAGIFVREDSTRSWTS